ncbi:MULTISPECIES: Nramp family divalent metal transporter [Arthrobacter]|uniref:Nramp family divalent metal transporter n=2 Tax=Arthrobacter TaxID=1663 RepID=A0ABU9KJK0_9MICC|nr:Nramp family divalent metal transporter [Arthrobacter sp. YJM1]MDP5227274.1 Nramp family divalent metal transporter [Arthrobacter sp. YJM1]
MKTALSTEAPARRATPGILLLGPAFVAAIAYVDPGNVAANLTAGAKYGYLLVWVLVAANLMGMMVQYQSAKLGLVTGSSLPELLGRRFPTWGRRLFWLQAEAVALATDLAEVVGGAIALKLLFGLPLLGGGLIVGAASMALLSMQSRRRQRAFENAVIVLLAIITVGFLCGLLVSPPDAGGVLGGLAPRFEDGGSVMLAASMLGATVMPHAIYVHSALARDRHRPRGTAAPDEPTLRRLLRATRWDVVTALAIAGVVNIGMLLLAASALAGREGTDSIEGAHAAIAQTLGPAIGVIFAVGLLASGLASTSVGSYAGATIMEGLLKIRIPLLARRVITLIPALVVLAVGVDPTLVLVLSQVALSFGIPFALIPLILMSRDRRLMGAHADGRALQLTAVLSTVLVVILNGFLIWLSVTGTA